MEPDAMPLDEYIAETMALLTYEPEATEIVVDATKPLRFAERDGVYEQRYTDWTCHARPERRRRDISGPVGLGADLMVGTVERGQHRAYRLTPSEWSDERRQRWR